MTPKLLHLYQSLYTPAHPAAAWIVPFRCLQLPKVRSSNAFLLSPSLSPGVVMDTFHPLNSHIQSLTKSSPLYHLTNTKLSLLAGTQGHNLDSSCLLREPQPLLPLPPFILCLSALSKISVTSRHPFSILLHCPQDKSVLLSSSGL